MRDATQIGEAILRVAEAFVDDVGRGWARVDPADLALLGAAPGDTGAELELVCKKAAMLTLEVGREGRAAPHISRAELLEAVAQVRPAAKGAGRFAGAVGRRSVV